MIRLIKNILAQTLERHGRRVVRYPLGKYLSDRRINVVLDVGANIGQYGQHLRALGYSGRIISFEPGQTAYQRLEQASGSDRQWSIHPFGLGNANERRTLNISGNLPSSSLLELEPESIEAAPSLAFVDRVEVEVRRLDDVLPQLVSPDDRIFLKIDTQGFERHVIEGAMQSLSRIIGVQMEVPLVSVYRGESLIESMIATMRDMDFIPYWLMQGYRNDQTMQLYEVDVIFLRHA